MDPSDGTTDSATIFSKENENNLRMKMAKQDGKKKHGQKQQQQIFQENLLSNIVGNAIQMCTVCERLSFCMNAYYAKHHTKAPNDSYQNMIQMIQIPLLERALSYSLFHVFFLCG